VKRLSQTRGDGGGRWSVDHLFLDQDAVPTIVEVKRSTDPRRMPASEQPGTVLRCLTAHGDQGYLTYQPASRYWAFQGIETGIYVVLAAVLLAVTFWVLRRRDA
jgi:hypothetical protein